MKIYLVILMKGFSFDERRTNILVTLDYNKAKNEIDINFKEDSECHSAIIEIWENERIISNEKFSNQF